MPAPKGNQYAKGNRGGKGGPAKYKASFADQALKACEAGFTDKELADLFGVNEATINAWKMAHQEFGRALKAGKSVADDRVERTLYHRAIGYEHEDVHVSNHQGKITLTPLRKYYPPDTTAAIFWLKNRRRDDWRDKVDHEHSGEMKIEKIERVIVDK